MQTNNDDWDSHWELFGDPTSGHAANRYRKRLLAELIGRPSDESHIFDFGCGQGEIAVHLASRFRKCQVVGLENSDSGVKRAEKRAAEIGVGALFLQRDLMVFPSETDPLLEMSDVAVCSEVLEHLDSPIEFLTNVSRFMKKSSTLIVTVPSGPMTKFDKLLGHRRHFSRASISEVISAAGFEILKVQRAGFPFFNIYRLGAMLRGDQLISDLKNATETGKPSLSYRLMMKTFDILFKLNFPNSPFGWQLIVVARRT
jgi:2-polyprenyl-3-methyl-5-hydroxy-6-metoxy-1,4-benzoquinol methylase